MKYKLCLKLKKCEWSKKEVKFLGFIIENNLIWIDLTKLTAVKEWRQSTNVKEVQFFLRFVNYNQKFIKHFSQIEASLHNLIWKNKSFIWDEKCKMTFQKLITVCTFKSVLWMFNLKKSICIETDASDLIIEECFMQEYKRKHHLIVYHFKKMSSAE